MNSASLPFLTFAHPWLASAALVAALLPIAIHLLNRRRRRELDWAAMMLLRSAVQRTPRRRRLSHWLLMAVRVLMVVALGLALARPRIAGPSAGVLGERRAHRILLLDDSCSMRARQGDTSRFEIARSAAVRLLDDWPAADPVSLITTSEHAAFAPAMDRQAVRDRLRELAATQHSSDVTAALQGVLDLVSESDTARFADRTRKSVLYFVSDFAAADWQGNQAGAAERMVQRVARRAELVFIPVGAPAANCAVSEVRVANNCVLPDLPITLAIDVVNHGSEAIQDAALRVTAGSTVLQELPLPGIAADGARSIDVTLSVPHDARSLRVGLRSTAPDGLPDDNHRFVALQRMGRADVLLVEGERTASVHDGASRYVSVALAAARDMLGGELVSPRVIGDYQLASEPLSDVAVVTLCNVARLSDENADRLLQFVRAGGGLIVFAGDRVDVEHYNRRGALAELLPATLRRPAASFRFVAGSGAGNDVLRLAARALRDHLSPFAQTPETSLFRAAVHRRLLATPRAGADVLMRYSDDSPALLLQRVGLGAVFLVTTSADMSWTNLPAKGDFVPWTIMLHAMAASQDAGAAGLYVGDAVRHRLGDGVGDAVLEGPDGRRHEPVLHREHGALVAAFDPCESSGIYTVHVAGKTRAYAANIERRESDLRPVSMESMRGRLSCAFAWRPPEALHRSDGLGRTFAAAEWLMGAAVVLLLLETLVAARLTRMGA